MTLLHPKVTLQGGKLYINVLENDLKSQNTFIIIITFKSFLQRKQKTKITLFSLFNFSHFTPKISFISTNIFLWPILCHYLSNILIVRIIKNIFSWVGWFHLYWPRLLKIPLYLILFLYLKKSSKYVDIKISVYDIGITFTHQVIINTLESQMI